MRRAFAQYILTSILLLGGFLKAPVAAETPATPTVVGKTARELWQARRLDELDRFLTVVSKRPPNRVIAYVAGAFLDLIYRGDLAAGKEKLTKVEAAIRAGQINVNEAFEKLLQGEIAKFDMIEKDLQSRGQSVASFKQKANPSEVREGYGRVVPELLQMLEKAPDMSIP